MSADLWTFILSIIPVSPCKTANNFGRYLAGIQTSYVVFSFFFCSFYFILRSVFLFFLVYFILFVPDVVCARDLLVTWETITGDKDHKLEREERDKV